MTTELQIDRTIGQALYRQIVEQIKTQISDGRLPAATQLPTVRKLATQLGVTRLTVQNAYSELASEGWVEATIGRGTFVSGAVQPRAIVDTMIAASGRDLTADAVLSDMIQIHQLENDAVAGVRAMAIAAPDPKLFPIDEFWSNLTNLRPDALSLMGYGSPQGDPVLRVELASQLLKRGLSTTPDDIIVTAGASHALSMVTQSLAQAGDVVLVEQPTYLGLLHILKEQNLRAIGIPMDDEGPELNLLERAIIQNRPRFFYTAPSFQNPTGLSISQKRRGELLDLAEHYGVMIIEDDTYARLAYDAPALPALKSLDRSGSVVYLTSESKVFIPDLRIGSIVAPAALHNRLLTLRRATDLCSSTILQRSLAVFYQNQGLPRHLKRVIPIYRKRRDAMLAALKRYMPEQVVWSHPSGGFCGWLTLPNTHALHDIHRVALQHGLALAPGEVFMPQPVKTKHLRLSFGNQSIEGIRMAVQLLATLIEERLDQDDQHARELYDWAPLV